MSTDTNRYHEARTRSVNSLQTLYAFVVGLAITEGLKHALTEPGLDVIQLRPEEGFVFVSLVATAVPFFHGANRYLDATYVTGERRTRRVALMIDFVLLLVQGVALYALALVSNDTRVFYSGLAGLLLFDVAWVLLTTLYTHAAAGAGEATYTKWAAVNVVAAGTLILLTWTDVIGWTSETAEGLFLMGVALARTFADYKVSWGFYYPEHDRAREGAHPVVDRSAESRT